MSPLAGRVAQFRGLKGDFNEGTLMTVTDEGALEGD